MVRCATTDLLSCPINISLTVRTGEMIPSASKAASPGAEECAQPLSPCGSDSTVRCAAGNQLKSGAEPRRQADALGCVAPSAYCVMLIQHAHVLLAAGLHCNRCVVEECLLCASCKDVTPCSPCEPQKLPKMTTLRAHVSEIQRSRTTCPWGRGARRASPLWPTRDAPHLLGEVRILLVTIGASLKAEEISEGKHGMASRTHPGASKLLRAAPRMQRPLPAIRASN
jgi:hypothetical protein